MKIKYCLLISFLFIFVDLSATVVVTNGLTHRHSITKAFERVEGKIVVRNQGLKEERVILYKQDVIPYCDRSLAYSDVNTHERSLGNWLTSSLKERVMAPGEEYSFYYSIEVPNGAAVQGTYWTILMVEVADPIKEEQENGFTLASKVRYGIQIIADIGAYLSPKIVFENITLAKDEGREKIVRVKLRNSGLFFSATQLKMELIDENGNKVITAKADSRKLYPGYCGDFEVVIRDLPKGVFDGILIADNGIDLFGSNVTVENN